MKSNNNIKIIGDFFVAEKTSDVFLEVEFKYEVSSWSGMLPKLLKFQGLDLTENEFHESLNYRYKILHPKNKASWIKNSDDTWASDKKENQTYKVLKALHSGEWECRVCGPVPKVNPQPAARLGALKKQGYIIGSKRKNCSNCNKKTMHDILIMLPQIESKFEDGNELRAPMSEKLKERIKKVLKKKEVCFNVNRTSVELIIDHKYPSQRWNTRESPNPDDMSEDDIKAKFQLLTNQTNMWKSRFCDTCVKTGKRGDFMGIDWYSSGDANWNGSDDFDEKGCYGCPWYDLEDWKTKLKENLNP